jgi:phosphatidate phosphatase APP1
MAVRLEERWDAWRVARRSGRPPEHLRIIPYMGHGSDSLAVVRGRVLDNPEPGAATEGEGMWAATRRTIARFNTVELPGVPLRVSAGNDEVDTETDAEGYFQVWLETDLANTDRGWVEVTVGLAGPYRGLAGDYEVGCSIRVPVPEAAFGIISDVDDTILHSGTRSAFSVLRNTVTGSELTRTPVAGATELWRGLAAGETGPDENPVFYLSSSPWNLYGFLAAFVEHRGFPRGPLLLRDLLGGDDERSHHSHKSERIDEILELHPQLQFVLLGDSAQDDPTIYLGAVNRHPGRIMAVYIRDVGGFSPSGVLTPADVPFVVAADWAAAADHAAQLGLIDSPMARAVRRAVDRA